MRIAVSISALFAASAALAADPTTPSVSRVMILSSRILDSADRPVTGLQTLTFGFYPSRNRQGPSEQPLWEETYQQSLNNQGIYTVELGGPEDDAGAVNKKPLDMNIFRSGAVWLEITVNGERQFPRLHSGSVPYALAAVDSQMLGGHGPDDFALAENALTSLTVTGNGPLTLGGTATEPTLSLPRASETQDGYLDAADFAAFAEAASHGVLKPVAPLAADTSGNLTIAMAGLGVTGAISAADWAAFNAKLSSVNAVAPLYSSGGSNPTLTMTQASTSNDGFVSKSDWANFNSKLSALAVASPLVSTGGTAPTLSLPQASATADGYVSKADWSAFNGKLSGVSVSGPLTSSGGTAPTISLPQASASVDGYLSKTDFAAFSAPSVSSVTAADATITVGGSGTSPTVAVNTSTLQARVTGTCSVGQAITAINANGTVVCGTATPPRVFRYAQWSSYDQVCCWLGGQANGDALMFGGVTPQLWGDGSGKVWNMSSDAETMRTLFNKKLYPGANAMVAGDVWYNYSSTNSRHTGVLMRIKSTNSSATNWPMSFYYTCRTDWGEYASASLNGAQDWQCPGNSSSNSTVTLTFSIPPNRTSTLIIASGSDVDSGYRANFLAFYNNSMNPPAGLSFVDDLDTLTGNIWTQ